MKRNLFETMQYCISEMPHRKYLVLLLVTIICLGILPLRVEAITERTVKIYAPAVTSTAEGYVGAITEITVSITSGSGEVFVSTTPLTQVDMQASARMAALIACQLVGENFYNYNFYVKVKSPALIIGGPSAGAEMTIAIASALKGWEINYSVMMTGMINPDETIGPVGGIPEKIEAAAKHGVKLFLIPLGQRYFTKYEIVEERVGPFIIRRIEPRVIDVVKFAEKLGIKVIEIGDIREAIYYFTGHYISIGNYTELPSLKEEIIQAFKSQFEELKIKAENEIRKAKESILDLSDSYSKKQLSKMLDLATALLSETEELASNRKYYSASSKAFQALINAQYVIYAADFIKGRSFDDIVREVKETIDEARKTVNEATIDNINALQFAIASKWRLKNAIKSMEEAAKYFKEGMYGYSLQELAYAKWRAKTAIQWIKLTSLSNGRKIDWDRIKPIIDNYIYEAETVIAYSQTVLSEMGVSSTEIKLAIEYLDDAKENYNKGDLILALSETMHSLVYASTAMSLLPVSEKTIDYQIEYARKKGLDSMWRLKKAGVDPILSYLYFEHSETLKDKKEKLLTYKLASIYSNTLNLILSANVTALPSTETPITSIKPTTPSVPTISQTTQAEIWPREVPLIWILLTGVVGLVLGFIIGVHFSSRSKLEAKAKNVEIGL